MPCHTREQARFTCDAAAAISSKSLLSHGIILERCCLGDQFKSFLLLSSQQQPPQPLLLPLLWAL